MVANSGSMPEGANVIAKGNALSGSEYQRRRLEEIPAVECPGKIFLKSLVDS